MAELDPGYCKHKRDELLRDLKDLYMRGLSEARTMDILTNLTEAVVAILDAGVLEEKEEADA